MTQLGQEEGFVETITPEKREEILIEFRRVRTPFKVSKNLGYSVEEVWAVIDDTPDALSPRQERFGGEGRPDLREFIVARKRCGTAWDNNSAEIINARAQYEAGTHDMMTHRDGNFEFLVSKPNRKVTPRPDYFKPEL